MFSKWHLILASILASSVSCSTMLFIHNSHNQKMMGLIETQKMLIDKQGELLLQQDKIIEEKDKVIRVLIELNRPKDFPDAPEELPPFIIDCSENQ